MSKALYWRLYVVLVAVVALVAGLITLAYLLAWDSLVTPGQHLKAPAVAINWTGALIGLYIIGRLLILVAARFRAADRNMGAMAAGFGWLWFAGGLPILILSLTALTLADSPRFDAYNRRMSMPPDQDGGRGDDGATA